MKNYLIFKNFIYVFLYRSISKYLVLKNFGFILNLKISLDHIKTDLFILKWNTNLVIHI
jgi:hypothetical protein